MLQNEINSLKPLRFDSLKLRDYNMYPMFNMKIFCILSYSAYIYVLSVIFTKNSYYFPTEHKPVSLLTEARCVVPEVELNLYTQV
jgi:hypothetical protein